MTTPAPPKPRLASARFVASAPEARHLPPPLGVEVAFAGRSNVGKSTLLNALMERKGLARTSSTPGCTREVVIFEAKAQDGAMLTLVDLPGYGYAKRSKAERASWGGMVEDYLLGRPTLAGVVLLVDCRRGLEEDDEGLLELVGKPPDVSRRPLETLIVATKLDRLSVSQRKPALEKIAKATSRRVVGFAESDRKTHDALWRAVRRIAGIPDAVLEVQAQGGVPTASAPASSRPQSP
jgi:GTP-binding protein